MATDVTGKVPYSSEALEDLRFRIRGDAIPGGDPGLSGVRAPFNTMHPDRPAVAITCTGTQDVVDGVAFARDRGLPLAVRGGGHSIAGLSTTDGGVLLDLAPTRGVVVDPDRRRVTVQGGALWGDVDHETLPFGLAVPGGVVSDTGVAGLTLGGGYGWLRRKYGLSCDSLVEAQVVCADGRVVTASETSHPDLFWALRGGGGNFGVVTSFTFEARPLPPVVAFAAVMHAVEDTAGLVRGWRDYVERAPREVTSEFVTITMPANPGMPEAVHDRPVAILAAVYAGDADDGMAALQPLRDLGDPLADVSGPTPFTAVQTGFDPVFPRATLRVYWKSQYLDALSDEAIDLFAARAMERPAPLTLLNLFHMGGAIADVPPHATAFAEREHPFMVSIDGMWADAAQDAEVVGWVRGAWDDFRPHGTGSVYLNFTGMAGEAPAADVGLALGRNLERLGAVKAEYDPGNLFRRNQNIVPAR